MLDSFNIASEVVSGVIANRNIQDPIESRKNAKNITENFNQNICPKYGIDVKYIFGEESIKKYPEIINYIQKYIDTGEINDNLPLLWLGNHQAFGLEAVGAYYYFPVTGKIMLKDDLLKPPLFGDGIKAIDPIVVYRGNKQATKIRNIEIKNQIINNKAVLIYPEGTRSKNGELQKFHSSLYKSAFDSIKLYNDYVSQKVAIITSDTFNVLPQTLEKSLCFMGKVNPGTITYTIDIVDISLYDNIKEFNTDIKNIIEKNLN